MLVPSHQRSLSLLSFPSFSFTAVPGYLQYYSPEFEIKLPRAAVPSPWWWPSCKTTETVCMIMEPWPHLTLLKVADVWNTHSKKPRMGLFEWTLDPDLTGISGWTWRTWLLTEWGRVQTFTSTNQANHITAARITLTGLMFSVVIRVRHAANCG